MLRGEGQWGKAVGITIEPTLHGEWVGKCRQGRDPTQESRSLPSNQPSAEGRPARPPAPALPTCVLVVCKGEGLCQLAGQEGVEAQAGHHGCHDGGNALQQQGGAREGERKGRLRAGGAEGWAMAQSKCSGRQQEWPQQVAACASHSQCHTGQHTSASGTGQYHARLACWGSRAMSCTN